MAGDAKSGAVSREYHLAVLDRERERAAAAEHLLRNLLARVHRDGGHYAAEHGLDRATQDADRIVAALIAEAKEGK